MYRAELDKEQKILFIELSGTFTYDETVEATKDIWIKISLLGRGAYIISDISNLKSGVRHSKIQLRKVMRLVDSYEPRAAIRIINDNNGAIIFDWAYRLSRARYKTYRVESKEKAMELIHTFNETPSAPGNSEVSN